MNNNWKRGLQIPKSLGSGLQIPNSPVALSDLQSESHWLRIYNPLFSKNTKTEQNND